MSRVPPRPLHPGAWWVWALGLVAAVTQTTNPVLVVAVIVACGLVVASRRPDAGWAHGYRAYLLVAGVVIGIRVAFRIVLGGDFGERALFTLPALPLPGVTGTLGGAVTLEEILAGLYDGLRLGAIVVCVGAANTIADPRRLVGSLPRAVGATASSIVVALSLAPQLVESLMRVRRARRLRGEHGGGWKGIRSLLVPVLEDTLHRSLALAASMDSRGYGRWQSEDERRAHRGLIWSGLAATVAGMFALLTSGGTLLPAMVLTAGLALASLGLRRLGRGLRRTRYRPPPWSTPEWAVSAAGLAAAVGVAVGGVVDPGALHPGLQPPVWPSLPSPALLGLALALLPGLVPPPLARPSTVREATP